MVVQGRIDIDREKRKEDMRKRYEIQHTSGRTECF
jgi:hypothetical protein